MQSWSNLPPEILNKIALKLDFYEDFINFLCVCSSWRSSVTSPKNFIQHLPSRFPMLMLADSEQESRLLYLLSNGGTICKVQLPEARRQRCISAHGWLLTTGDEEFSSKLIHPFSRTQIHLPELYMFEELYFDQDEWIYYRQCMRKVVFTSSNPLSFDPSNSFRVVIIWGETIGFCRLGDVSWTRINGNWEGQLLDTAYHSMRKRLYVATSMGSIYECDIHSDGSCPLTLRRVSTFPGEEESGCSYIVLSSYLLEWGYDSLLMVTRERQHYKKHEDEYGVYGPYRTNRFRCFVFSLDGGKWSELMSLGKKSAFLGFNSSFAIDAGGGVKPNCIYFTDDLYEPYRDLPKGGGSDFGVYHVSDGCMEPIFNSQASVFRGSPPLWLQTSILVPT